MENRADDLMASMASWGEEGETKNIREETTETDREAEPVGVFSPNFENCFHESLTHVHEEVAKFFKAAEEVTFTSREDFATAFDQLALQSDGVQSSLRRFFSRQLLLNFRELQPSTVPVTCSPSSCSAHEDVQEARGSSLPEVVVSATTVSNQENEEEAEKEQESEVSSLLLTEATEDEQQEQGLGLNYSDISDQPDGYNNESEQQQVVDENQVLVGDDAGEPPFEATIEVSDAMEVNENEAGETTVSNQISPDAQHLPEAQIPSDQIIPDEMALNNVGMGLVNGDIEMSEPEESPKELTIDENLTDEALGLEILPEVHPTDAPEAASELDSREGGTTSPFISAEISAPEEIVETGSHPPPDEEFFELQTTGDELPSVEDVLNDLRVPFIQIERIAIDKLILEKPTRFERKKPLRKRFKPSHGLFCPVGAASQRSDSG